MKKDYDEIYDEGHYIDVHGGLTYSSNKLMGINSNNWFIGWDYAHCNDCCGLYEKDDFLNEKTKKWTTEEIIKECEDAIDQILEINKKGDI